MKDILLQEFAETADFHLEVDLNESEGSGGMYLTGVFMQAEKLNRNGRVYPKHVLERAVSAYMQEHSRNRLPMLGELNHPPRADIDPLKAAIVVEDMWWVGNDVHGRARVLVGDGAEGDKLHSLLKAGFIPGVSSRGLGSLTDSGKGYKIVNEGYRLTVPIDVVLCPSAPDAFLKAD